MALLHLVFSRWWPFSEETPGGAPNPLLAPKRKRAPVNSTPLSFEPVGEGFEYRFGGGYRDFVRFDQVEKLILEYRAEIGEGLWQLTVVTLNGGTSLTPSDRDFDAALSQLSKRLRFNPKPSLSELERRLARSHDEDVSIKMWER